jgi:hypothetical protein
MDSIKAEAGKKGEKRRGEELKRERSENKCLPRSQSHFLSRRKSEGANLAQWCDRK